MQKTIKGIIIFLLKYKLRKRALMKGKVYLNLSSNITLMHGSCKNDIVIGNNVRMYGHLISQSNGKIIIEDNVQIGYGTIIGSVLSIKIQDGALLAHNIEIMDNNNHPIHPNERLIMNKSDWNSPLRRWKNSISKEVIIGKNVWIGSGVRINKGVTIDDNSIIATNSVVTKNVPKNCIAAGNPAKIVKTNINIASDNV